MQVDNFLNLTYVQQWVLCFIVYKSKINTDISFYLDDDDLCKKISSMMTYDNYYNDVDKLNKEISQLVTYDIIKFETISNNENEYDDEYDHTIPTGYYVLTKLGILYIRDKLIMPINLLKNDVTYSKLKNKCDKNKHTSLDQFRDSMKYSTSSNTIAGIIIDNSPKYLHLINMIFKQITS